MKLLRVRKVTVCLLLLTILLSICNTTYEASGSSPYKDHIKYSDRAEIQLSNNNEVSNVYVTTENFLSSFTSVIYEEQANRLLKKENRIYVNSIFSILFKIAVIPGFTFIIFIFMVCVLSFARLWIMTFIHKSDGKKEKRIFLPV